MTQDEIDDLFRQLKSITNCLYGIGAAADSVYSRLEELARLARFALTLSDKVPICGYACRIDPINWSLYENGRDIEDGSGFDIIALPMNHKE